MNLLLRRLLALYVLFALIGKFVERLGAVRCECAASCWCRKPVLSVFRWTLPIGHASQPHH